MSCIWTRGRAVIWPVFCDGDEEWSAAFGDWGWEEREQPLSFSDEREIERDD